MNWKTFFKKILFPPLWLIILLFAVSAASLTAVFVNGWDEHPLAYAAYVVSFYTLCVVCVACWYIVPKHYKNAKDKMYSNSFVNRYMTDPAFKTNVSLYRSLTINLLYVGVNLVSGFLYRSAWFFILAGYYTILAVMRFLLVKYARKNKLGARMLGELKRSRLCGWILITVNLSLSGAVLMILYQDRGYDYHGILIYVMAMYTFYITVTAVINLFKYKKYRSPVMSTSKMISFAAALVSMLNLETAMLAEFGVETGEHFKKVMVAATGAGVSVIIVTMALYVIIRNTAEIKKYKSTELSNG